MIHHISLPVQDPIHVAQVLAEIWHGQVLPFPPHPGSYIVIAGDDYGSLIELYPLGSEIVPGTGEGQASFVQHSIPSGFYAVHAAISVPASLEEIERIAEREGWRVLPCNRDGLFDVVEFWVENRLMLELLPPTIAPIYLKAMKEGISQLLETSSRLANSQISAPQLSPA